MSLKIVFSTSLKGFRPIIWYGKPIFTQAGQIKAILQQYLSLEHANLLTAPHLTDEAQRGIGKAYWLAEHISAKAKPLTYLPEAEQKGHLEKLSGFINDIEALANQFLTSEDINLKQYGEILLQAIEIPSLDYILVENNQLAMVCWGFYTEQAGKSKFKLSKLLVNYTASITKPVTPEITQEIKDIKQITVDQIPKQQEIYQPQQIQQIVKKENQKKRKKRFWWWLLLALLLLLLLLLLLYFTGKFFKNIAQLTPSAKLEIIHRYLPPEQGIYVPVDPDKIIIDTTDPGKRKIVSDRINIVIHKDSSFNDFIYSFKTDTLNASYKILYYDTVTRHIQLKIPDSERATLKNKLKQKYPAIRLAWDESLFSFSLQTNDPDFSNAKKKWALERIKAPEAWNTTIGDSNIIIAIVDDGFDLTHPEFSGKIIKPWNVPAHDSLVNCANGKLYHGTHVASIALGNINNASGLCGVAPGCKFMPVQVADNNGNMTTTAIISGILYAIAKNADVINLSLGMIIPGISETTPLQTQNDIINAAYKDEVIFWQDLFDYSDENNIVVVLAAGNSNILTGVDPFQRTLNTIKVGAASNNNKKAGFSNYGKYTTIAAPGVEIYSAIPNNKYQYLDGTSMAAPMVTGAVALIKSVSPKIKFEEIVTLLKETGLKHAQSNDIGNIIQLDAAIIKAKDISPDDKTISNNKPK